MFQLSDVLNERPTKIILFVVDGLGGYATSERGSELEEASTPNLDALAAEGSVGLLDPLSAGITVGSGPGHLALFGYDPLEYELGRGVLSATGVGFPLEPGDIAARGNLAILDADGNVTDRRAGRIADDQAEEVTATLADRVQVDGVEVMFQHISSHRVLCVVRGTDGGPTLDHRLRDMDPQETGVPPLRARALHEDAEATAKVMDAVAASIQEALADDDRADALLLRGFDTLHELPTFQERYGLRAACAATYPMYRGVARLCGMDMLPTPHGLDEQLALLQEHWDDHDYFFVHVKAADQAGHDGLWDDKVAAIEEVDRHIRGFADLGPNVLVVTGDHSSPTQLSGHSWHPVPTLMWGPHVGKDDVEAFGERAAVSGLLGRLPTKNLMTVMLAASGHLEKWGA